MRTYWKIPEFREAYKAATSERLRDAADQSKQAAPRAVSTLSEIASDESVNAAVRVSACRSILEYCLKLTERNDIIERLDALEKRIKENGH